MGHIHRHLPAKLKAGFSLLEALVSLSLLGLVLALMGMLGGQYLRLSNQHNERSRGTVVTQGMLTLSRDLESAIEVIKPTLSEPVASELIFRKLDPSRPRFPSDLPPPILEFDPASIRTVKYTHQVTNRTLIRHWGEQRMSLLEEIEGLTVQRLSPCEIEISASYLEGEQLHVLRHRICIWRYR